MKKPKSKSKRKADLKRATKRSVRFKASRNKLLKRREVELEKKRAENKKHEAFVKKMIEARLNGKL